jgi:predicted permease
MTIVDDIRDTWRALGRSPSFTIPVVLSLAVAIGANVAAFSIVNTLSLRPLPVEAPDRLFHITYAGDARFAEGGNYSWFELLRDRSHSLSAVFIANQRSMKLSLNDRVEIVSGQQVSGGYFSGLGVATEIGRLISASDDTGAAPDRVAVLSDSYWARRFGRDPGILGRTVRVDGVPHQIIGVTERSYTGLEVGNPVDVTVPIDGSQYRTGWTSMALLVRLSAGVSASAAEGELTSRLREFAAAVPARAALLAQHVTLAPMTTGFGGQGGVRDRYLTPVVTASAILGVMLLLACANWAMLVLAKMSARRRDLTIRVALGSSRLRIARQLVIESVSLALAGGGLGFLVASWSVGYLPGRVLPPGLRIEPDLTVLLFAMAVALASGLLFAFAPVWLSRRLELDDLRVSRRLEDAHGARIGQILVAGQVALSLVLVVGAALLGATLQNLRSQDMGFSGDGVVTFALDADGTNLEGEPLTSLHRRILERLRTLPGVESATLASVSPLSGNEDGKGITIPGFVPQSPDDLIAQVDTVGPDYFATFGIPILRGRAITEDDREGAPHVALLSESAARFYFPGQDPIGRRIEIRGSTTLRPEIIGLVPDVKYAGLRRPAGPMFYVPFYHRYAEGEYVFAVRARVDPGALSRQIASEVGALAPEMPVLALRSFAAQVNAQTANERLLAMISWASGALALLLSGIGVHGLVAYLVARRTAELGLRIALGATRRRLAWFVLRGAVAVVVFGIVVGLAAALAASGLVSGIVFGLQPTDPRVYVASGAFLLIAGVASTIPPLLRALRIHPVTALRCE